MEEWKDEGDDGESDEGRRDGERWERGADVGMDTRNGKRGTEYWSDEVVQRWRDDEERGGGRREIRDQKNNGGRNCHFL